MYYGIVEAKAVFDELDTPDYPVNKEIKEMEIFKKINGATNRMIATRKLLVIH